MEALGPGQDTILAALPASSSDVQALRGTCRDNGTSSASAIVAGAATSLQGFYKSRYAQTLTSTQMRGLLRDFGTPQTVSGGCSGHIGPQPDLKKTIEHLLSAKGDFYGDSKADILWYNNATGTLYQQQMNGFSLALPPPSTPSPIWTGKWPRSRT